MTVMFSPARPAALLLAATFGLASFVVAACSDTSEPAPTGAQSAAAPGNEVTVPVSVVTTELVDAGAEPRTSVSRRAAAGTTQQVTLHSDSHVIQRIDDQPVQNYSQPPLTVPLTAVTIANGVDLTLGKVTSSDAQLAAALPPAQGSRAGFTVDASGAVTALRISPAADTADKARSAIEQALYQAVYRGIPLPHTDIGVGAKWVIRQQVSGSVPLDQVTTATLTEREGDRLGIAVDVVQTPKSKVWNLPDGAGILNIDSYVMRGSGVVTLDLAQPLPVQADVTVGGDQAYSDPHTGSKLFQNTDNRVQWAG